MQEGTSAAKPPRVTVLQPRPAAMITSTREGRAVQALFCFGAAVPAVGASLLSARS